MSVHGTWTRENRLKWLPPAYVDVGGVGGKAEKVAIRIKQVAIKTQDTIAHVWCVSLSTPEWNAYYRFREDSTDPWLYLVKLGQGQPPERFILAFQTRGKVRDQYKELNGHG